MKFVATRNCSLVEGGKAQRFTVGSEVSSTRYKKFTPSFQRNFTSKRSWSGQHRQLWPTGELYALIDTYLEFADPESATIDEVISRQSEMYPERSVDAIHARCWSILGLDKRCPHKGLDTYSTQLIEVLKAIDPERFAC